MFSLDSLYFGTGSALQHWQYACTAIRRGYALAESALAADEAMSAEFGRGIDPFDYLTEEEILEDADRYYVLIAAPATRVRAAFLFQLFSHFECSLGLLARTAATAVRYGGKVGPAGPSSLNVIERWLRFFQEKLLFVVPEPESELWQVQAIRNALAHGGGMHQGASDTMPSTGRGDRAVKIDQWLSTHSNLATAHFQFIEFKEPAIPHLCTLFSRNFSLIEGAVTAQVQQRQKEAASQS